ncbi:MAG: P-loop NTPase fold protein [Actinomycetota bacterium]
MWPDNETSIDLLGFEHLVDALEIVLTDSKLLPVTVGVVGDWGSGKTSLIRMAEEKLKQIPGIVTVSFNPWRFEGYDDMKAALMSAVISEIERKIEDNPTVFEKVARGLKRLARIIGLVRAAPIAAAALASAAHAPTAVALMLGEMAGAVAEAATEEKEDEDTELVLSIAEFHQEFERIMKELGDEVEAVIVFVDDLDRCLPETIINTFEAIRLFLHVNKTAYVIAAHPRIVEAAIEARYIDNRRGDENLGRDYLEKIFQMTITVPALSEPEVESYINLLLSEQYLEREELDKLREEASKRRREGQFGVVMNYGIASGIIGGSKELDSDFALANQIAPVLARGLRGNPRQIKRFLNTFMLRRRTAERRGIDLDPAILAKLMILELNLEEFKQLFLWQLVQDGQPNELVEAEEKARSNAIQELEGEVATWAARPNVLEWLCLDPPLADLPLGRYFYFSRDRLSPAAPAARLSAALQELLARLQVDSDALRRAAINEAVSLPREQIVQVFDALLEKAIRKPEGPAMDSSLELAAKQQTLIDDFANALERIPVASVPIHLPLKIRLTFGDQNPRLEAVLDSWDKCGSGDLRNAIVQARSKGDT